MSASKADKTIYLASTDFGILEAEASKVTAKQAVVKSCVATGHGTTLSRETGVSKWAPKHMVPGFFDTREEAENALRVRLVEDLATAEEAFREAYLARNRASERVRRMTVSARPFRLVPIDSIGYDAGPGPLLGYNDAPEDPEQERLEENTSSEGT